MAKCPPPGKRVCFTANPAGAQFYRGWRPANNECGTTIAIPVPGGKKTCLPGPAGGLIYVDFDRAGVMGVFRSHLVDAKGRTLGRARRRR